MTTFAPTTVLAKMIEETVVDTRLSNAVTLDLLAKNGRTRSTTYQDIFWDAIVTTGAVARTTMVTAGTDQTTGATVQATLGLGTYKIYHQFTMNRVALINAASRGVGSLKRAFQMHIDDGILNIRRDVNQLIWAGTGSAGDAGVVGMVNVLDPTLAYANIDPATYTRWVPILNTNATNRALTKTILMDFHRVQKEQEVFYDAIVTSPTMAQTYNALFDTVAGNYQLTGGSNSNVVDLAPGQRHYDGVPIVEDPMCPLNQIVTFEKRNLEVVSFDLSDADQGVLGELGLKDNFSSIKSAKLGGLTLNCALLPQTNPGTFTFQIFTIPQFVVRNRRQVQAINKLT